MNLAPPLGQLGFAFSGLGLFTIVKIDHARQADYMAFAAHFTQVCYTRILRRRLVFVFPREPGLGCSFN